MTQDLDLIKTICWKVSDFIATRGKNDEFGIFMNSREKKSDVYRTMREYPATFISPPKDAYDDLYIGKVSVGNENAWIADIPLWSEEEGKSDLYLIVNIILDADLPRVELDGCLVR